MDIDTPMPDYNAETGSKTRHFIVAVDFGTTFSSVAYVGYERPSQRPRIGLKQIETVDNYPYNPYENFLSYDVPTEIWYSERATVSPSEAINLDQHRSLLDDLSADESEEEESYSNLPALSQEYIDLTQSGRPPISLFWGYGAQEQLRETDNEIHHTRHLSRFKLLLDKSDHTAKVRNQIGETCKSLKKLRLIENDTDTIADFLEQLFLHIKKRLTDTGDYTCNSSVEFALCVPAIWSSWAGRQMQIAMVRAIKRSELGVLKHDSIDNLFLVSEPEAAAACLLADDKTRLSVGDTFILLDAGGGTVDAITYTVDKNLPLRLRTEEVSPGGAMCGSSFINERFERILLERLKNEDYLERDGDTIARIINGLVVDFERQFKKKMDMMLVNQSKEFTVRVPGLRENKKLRFRSGMICFKNKEVRSLFKPSWEGVAQLMMDQLKGSQENEKQVKKVILMGGFGQSESLAAYLKETLLKEYGFDNPISLYASKLKSNAVACGAVVRALKKEDGPRRIIQSSYGFRRTEPYGAYEAHLTQEKFTDKVDGVDYIKDTIEWVINKGDLIESEQVFERKVEYTFGLRTKRFVRSETLFVSDHRHESHYKYDHPKNDGAEVAGYIEVDLGAIKSMVKPQQPTGKGRIQYWKICATLLIFVSGRNLRYEIRWPNSDGEVQKVGQTSIAAAFRPGTE